MIDNRVRQLATADAVAHMYRRRPIFVFKTDGARATYLFGKRVQQSGWSVDHPEPFRAAYKRYHQRVEHILREPTQEELAGMLPAFHPLQRKDGKPMTVGDYQDFTQRAWKAKQVADVVRLVQQAEAQYVKEDMHP